jgi:hypothetical protein
VIPLYGFVKGDTLGLLVLVQGDDTIQTLAAALAQAASPRVACTGKLSVRKGEHVLDPAQTVICSGLTALDRVDLIVEKG